MAVFAWHICWLPQVMRSPLEEPPESLAIGEDGYSSVHSGTAYHDVRCGRQSFLPGVMASQHSFGRAEVGLVGRTSDIIVWSRSRGTRPSNDSQARRRTLTAGEVFGEVAFFTEVTQHEGIRSTSVCRVLTIPRAGYNTIAQTFPIGSRNVLDNLLAKAQQVMSCQACIANRPMTPVCCQKQIRLMLNKYSCMYVDLPLSALGPGSRFSHTASVWSSAWADP